MPYYSILFPSPAQEAQAKNCPWLTFRARRPGGAAQVVTRGNKTFSSQPNHLTNQPETPLFFADIGLDSMLDAVLPGNKPEQRRVYYALAADRDTVCYRQAVMRALEREEISALFLGFCRAVEGAMRTMADGRTVHSRAQADQYTVDGAVAYCDAVAALLAGAAGVELASEGLMAFVEAVRAYAAQPLYRQMETLSRQAKTATAAISFSLRVRKGRVIVCNDAQSVDFAAQTRADLTGPPEAGTEPLPMREIRLFGELAFGPLGLLVAGILEKRHPAAFALLHRAAGEILDIPADFIRRFLEELRFYESFLDTANALRKSGLPFDYPIVTGDDTLRIAGMYDMDLALQTNTTVVPSDCLLLPGERGVIVTGANHSGKTTFLRALGQTAVLAALGLPVPCKQAELPLFRGFYSHFSEAEEGEARQGRLKEELRKLKPILTNAGKGSVVLLNEMFSSTTAQDAQDMADRVLATLTAGGARVFCVTHNAGTLADTMVSMVAQVAPGSHERLYRVVRAPAETHAHVEALVEKYRLTYQAVRERIGHGV